MTSVSGFPSYFIEAPSSVRERRLPEVARRCSMLQRAMVVYLTGNAARYVHFISHDHSKATFLIRRNDDGRLATPARHNNHPVRGRNSASLLSTPPHGDLGCHAACVRSARRAAYLHPYPHTPHHKSREAQPRPHPRPPAFSSGHTPVPRQSCAGAAGGGSAGVRGARGGRRR